MASNLIELLRWFPSGTAEGERSILERVFVYVDEFANVMAPPTGNPHLLIGSKGSGKSAVIDFAVRVLEQQGVPAVLLTPFDIDSQGLGDASSTGDMARAFYSILLLAIAGKMSEKSTGWSDANLSIIYQEAVKNGARSPDFLGRMANFIAESSKSLTNVDLNKAFPHLTTVTKKELEGAISRALNRNSFYIFIDDTDQVANPDQPGHLNRIWALLLAVRRLTSQVPQVRAVVTLRSEVWKRLQVDPKGQRDQTDHFKSLCITLNSSREHVGNIIDRRLSMAADHIERPGDPYAPFFEGQFARAPFSENRRSWRDLIIVRSRERPRDAIQLTNLLAKRALSDQKSAIDESTFRAVMPTFSEQIANLFSQEVILECPNAIEILRTFSSIDYNEGGFVMTSDQALDHFRKVTTKFGVKLYGTTLNQTKESDIFELWRFFYLSGVLNARVSDKNEKDGYRHLDPGQDSALVSKARWNDLQKTLWEVNTVYRDFLINLHNEEAAKTGLAVKRPRGTPRRRRG